MIMSNVYLPAPSLTAKDWGPTAAEISAVAGPEVAEPFTTREQARRAAQQAIGDLTDNRPGGTTWKAAVAADTAAVAAGKAATAIAKLIDGDAQRYGQAVATVAVHQQTANVKANLDRPLLEAAIETVQLEATTAWAKLANQAWSARADHHKTWQLYRDGNRELSRWRAADQIASWLEGRRRHHQTDPATWRREQHLPNDRFARGAWLCTGLVLNPTETWWHLPTADDVEWPLDGWPLVEKALQPSAVHAVNGGAEVTTRPTGHGHTTKGRADTWPFTADMSA